MLTKSLITGTFVSLKEWFLLGLFSFTVSLEVMLFDEIVKVPNFGVQGRGLIKQNFEARCPRSRNNGVRGR